MKFHKLRILGLRKPRRNEFKDALINIGSQEKPLWHSFKDYPKNLEIIRKPPSISNTFNEKNSFNQTMSFFKINPTNKKNLLNEKNKLTHISSPFNTNNLQNIQDLYVFNYNLLLFDRLKARTYFKRRKAMLMI